MSDHLNQPNRSVLALSLGLSGDGTHDWDYNHMMPVQQGGQHVMNCRSSR